MSMPTDHGRGEPVARRVTRVMRAGVAAGLVIGCGPTVRPPSPPDEPVGVARYTVVRPQQRTPGREIVLGEMCPQGAAGRPAVAPLMMRTVSWTDADAEVSNAVERGSVPRFVVFGVDGKQAGVFDTMGVTDLGIEQAVAAGTYVGAGPCTSDAGGGARGEEPRCGITLGGCGLAIGEVARPDDPPPTPKISTGGACLSGDSIAIDIDGDGVAEAFPLASVLDGGRSPAAEWSAAPTAGAACTPTFQLYDLRLVRAPEAGRPVDPKWTVGLDVMGVADLDGDARMELVLAFRFPTARTIAVYSALGSPQRLELVGENESFPR